MTDKPPYSIPSMTDIDTTPRNGLTVVSTFAGGGGSSLGYRMAGFKVLAASEFIAAAADVYELNAAPGTLVMRDDIRDVTGKQILKRIGLSRGDLDVLDGSPPCAAFSVVGKRSAGWGEQRHYSNTTQRVDDLFFEFVRVLDDLQPRAFVAENVAGLGQGQSQGYFKMIHAAMTDVGYRVRAKVLDARWLGVPQTRRRLIFVGVRNDQPFEPVHPTPLPYFYTMRDAVPALVGQVRPTSGGWNEPDWADAHRHPSSCFGSTPTMPSGRFPVSNVEADEDPPLTEDPECGSTLAVSEFTASRYPQRRLRRLTIAELRRLASFPADYQLTGTYLQRWERIGRAVPPLMMRQIASRLAAELTA